MTLEQTVNCKTRVAWRVRVKDYIHIVFAETGPRAKYIAVSLYWGTWGRGKSWPDSSAKRVPMYDNSYLNNDRPGRCFCERIVAESIQ